MGAAGVCQRYRSGQAPQPSGSRLAEKESSGPENVADSGVGNGQFGPNPIRRRPLGRRGQHEVHRTNALSEIVLYVGQGDLQNAPYRAIGNGRGALEVVGHRRPQARKEFLIGHNHAGTLRFANKIGDEAERFTLDGGRCQQRVRSGRCRWQHLEPTLCSPTAVIGCTEKREFRRRYFNLGGPATEQSKEQLLNAAVRGHAIDGFACGEKRHRSRLGESRSRLPAISVDDGKATVFAECLRRHAWPWWRLATFVFRQIDKTHNSFHDSRIVTRRNDFFDRMIALDIHRQNRIELFVWREALVVTLIGT